MGIKALWIAAVSWYRMKVYEYHHGEVGLFWWKLFYYCCRNESYAYHVVNWLRHISLNLLPEEQGVLEDCVDKIWNRHIYERMPVMPLKEAEDFMRLDLVYEVDCGLLGNSD